MTVSRREFVSRAGVAAALPFLSPLAFAEQSRSVDRTDYRDWSAVRGSFRLRQEFVHLGLFYLTSHPRPVRDAIEYFREQLDGNPFLTVEHGLFDNQHTNQELEVRKAIAGYAGLSPDDIALTSNTTTGLALVYQGLPLGVGDEVLTTAHDHYVHHESIRLAVERSGATMRRVRLFEKFEDITEDSLVDALSRSISPATRVCGLTWVHSSSGLKLPVRRMADVVAEVNRNRPAARRILLVVDGVHGLGVEPPALGSLGADFFVAGTHKWIFAPRGTGFIWAPPENWALLRPIIPTFSSQDVFAAWASEKRAAPPARASWIAPGGFLAFEHFWAVPAAFEFHRRIGTDRVTARIHGLNSAMKEGLSGIRRVRVYTPLSAKLSAGMVCFDIDGLKQTEVVARLLEKGIIATTTPYATSYARVAAGLPNTEDEIERTVRAVREIAGA